MAAPQIGDQKSQHIGGDNDQKDMDCSYFKIASKILKQHFPNIPLVFFDNAGDKCYCLKCHAYRGDNIIYKRGKPPKRYGLPLEFARFGLKTDPGFCSMNNIWDEWHAAYHGTKKETVPKIFKGRLILLKPDNIAINGNKLSVRKGHIKNSFKRFNKFTKQIEEFDPMQIYITPSIKYASNPIYAEWFTSKHPDNNNIDIKVQFIFQVRIRPGSYGVGQETIGAQKKGLIIDSNFSNNEVEWYTKENIGIILHGLLLRFIEMKNSDNNTIKIIDYDHLKQKNNALQKELNLLKMKMKMKVSDADDVDIDMSHIIDDQKDQNIDKILLHSLLSGNNQNIAKTFKSHIVNLGNKYIEEQKIDIDDLDIKEEKTNNFESIQQLIKLHNKYLMIVKNNKICCQALIEAFEELMDKEYYTSALLAFVNDILKYDTKIAPTDLDNAMDNIVMLYGYIKNKDVFERDYQQALASRLLQDSSRVYNPSERAMISKLKTKSGYHWPSKLEDMLKDIQRSKELMVEFGKKYNDFDIEFNVSVCTTGAWPTSSIEPIIKPPDIGCVSDRFTQFYLNRFSGRRLNFQMSKGMAEVSVQFNANTQKILVVNTYQMVVLLQFNIKNTWTFKELLDATRIPRKELIVTTSCMAHPTVHIMRKSPNTKDIQDTHKFQINPKYSNPDDKISVATLEITMYASISKRIHDDKMESIYRSRRHQMDAAIVRIMKHRKTVKHADLVTGIVKELRGRFTPKPVDIKKRIANLIELEYLERDQNNRQLYHYWM